jgi:hypothetical protein
MAKSGTYFADDYHLFGVDWQSDHLTYYADGKPILTVTGQAVPRTAMYLIFNLAVGGIMGGDTAATPDRSTMAVDYVRAWRGTGTAPVGAAVDGSSPASPAPRTSAPTQSPTTSGTSRPASTTPGSATASAVPRPTHSSTHAPASPPPATPVPQHGGDPSLEILAPSANGTVRGNVTVRVRVDGPRERVQEVSFYVNSRNCSSPKSEAVWIGYDRDDDNDGVYVHTFDSRRLANGCNTISVVGIDAEDENRYYPYNRVHLDVAVAN